MLILFIMPHTCPGGGRGIFLNSEFDFFFLDDLHFQIIASISPKAAVENSSAQWAIFLNDKNSLYNQWRTSTFQGIGQFSKLEVDHCILWVFRMSPNSGQH